MNISYFSLKITKMPNTLNSLQTLPITDCTSIKMLCFLSLIFLSPKIPTKSPMEQNLPQTLSYQYYKNNLHQLTNMSYSILPFQVQKVSHLCKKSIDTTPTSLSSRTIRICHCYLTPFTALVTLL